MLRKLLRLIGGPPAAPVFNKPALILSGVGALLGAVIGDLLWLRRHTKENVHG